MSLSNSELAANLLRELGEYDGKSTAILGEIAHRWSREPTYLGALLDILTTNNPVLQNGASWLFKSFLEMDGSVSGDISGDLSKRVTCLSDWAAMLHVCQSIRYLTFAGDDARVMADWIRPLLTHNRPFLRAWALDALLSLSSFDPALRPDAEMALARALEDSAASVRARARNLKLTDGQ